MNPHSKETQGLLIIILYGCVHADGILSVASAHVVVLCHLVAGGIVFAGTVNVSLVTLTPSLALG